MRIEDLRKERIDGSWVRVAARVSWEQCDLPAFDLHFDTSEAFEEDIDCNPDAFVVASAIPAMHFGEERIAIQGKVCPQLRTGLHAAIAQLRAWYGEARHVAPRIEPSEGFEAAVPDPTRRCASFMSGGIDALAALRRNRLDLPLDHPASIRDGFFVHGLDIGSMTELGDNLAHFEWVRGPMAELAAVADFTLVPVRTNAALLGGNYDLFLREAHGSVIASIAHVFHQRIGHTLIPSSESVYDASPWGSSPLLDPHYSSAGCAIGHACAADNRVDKVAFVAEWEEVLPYLRSCYDPHRVEQLNCSRCEKCLRTMTELLACGCLASCPTFALDDLSPADLAPLGSLPAAGELALLRIEHTLYWEELLAPLRAAGRDDLARVIEVKIREAGIAPRPTLRQRARRLVGRIRGGGARVPAAGLE